MAKGLGEAAYFIGWDVGGWNCDRNPRSRDAITILNSELSIIGKPWRGNLRKTFNKVDNSQGLIISLFDLCGAEIPDSLTQIILGIDTPLGFSEKFIDLVTKCKDAGIIENSGNNPYLFRKTERFLFEEGFTPLSAVKDMIGSQATKGIHFLARYAPGVLECGVWSDGRSLKVIEAYPAACKNSKRLKDLRNSYPKLAHVDCDDALICALIAYLYGTDKEALVMPDGNLSAIEGWIWVPKDALEKRSV